MITLIVIPSLTQAHKNNMIIAKLFRIHIHQLLFIRVVQDSLLRFKLNK